jgi:hypothetical protein
VAKRKRRKVSARVKRKSKSKKRRPVPHTNSAREVEPVPDLVALRAAMIAAHPDKGGKDTPAFMAAKAAYAAAKLTLRSRATRRAVESGVGEAAVRED